VHAWLHLPDSEVHTLIFLVLPHNFGTSLRLLHKRSGANARPSKQRKPCVWSYVYLSECFWKLLLYLHIWWVVHLYNLHTFVQPEKCFWNKQHFYLQAIHGFWRPQPTPWNRNGFKYLLCVMNLKAQQRWPPTALPFFKRLNVLSTRQSGVWVMTSKECFTCSRPLKAQRLCSLGDEGHNTRKRSVGVGWSSFTVPRSTIKLHVWWHHCLHMLCFNRSYLLQVPDPARAEW